MHEDYSILENEILDFIKKLLAEHANDLKNLGIFSKIQEIRKETQPNYRSELEVDFSDENGIFKVMEFFIYENSKPSASKKEFEDWINDFFKDLLKGKPDY